MFITNNCSKNIKSFFNCDWLTALAYKNIRQMSSSTVRSHCLPNSGRKNDFCAAACANISHGSCWNRLTSLLFGYSMREINNKLKSIGLSCYGLTSGKDLAHWFHFQSISCNYKDSKWNILEIVIRSSFRSDPALNPLHVISLYFSWSEVLKPGTDE